MKYFAILLVLLLLLAGCSNAPAQESTVPSTTLPVQTEPTPSASSEPASLPPESTAPEKETEYYIFIPEDDPGLTWLWGYLGIKLEDYPNPYLYAKNMDTREICLLLNKDTKMFLQNGEDVYCITGENELYRLRLDIPGSQTLLYTAQHGTLSSLTLSLDSPYLEKITGICFLDGDQAVGMDYPAGNVLFDVECPGAQWVWANTTDSFYWKNAAGERFLRDCLANEDLPVAYIGEESTDEK